MTVLEMAELLSAEVKVHAKKENETVATAYAGDMLSDVLSLGSQPDVLLTGLLNPQVIRTAEMLDTSCVVFLRGKEPADNVLELAKECEISVLTSHLEMYEACGILFSHGLTSAE